jgi:hypothetical protein
MAIRNKLWYCDRILNEVYPVRSRDESIDKREVILVMDSICNALAKQGLLESWKLGATNSVEAQFTTTFEWLTLTDVANQHSYVAMPANYVSIPNNGGIVRVYFQNLPSTNKKKYFDPVIVMNARDVESYRNTLGGDLEGRLGCYPKSGNLYFNKPLVNSTYGPIGIQLLVRSSADITDSAVYPIPADFEHEFILRCVEHFRNRKEQPIDLIKDSNDKP